MDRYGLPAYIKLFCNGVQVQGPGRNKVNDLPPGGVGNRLENVSSDDHNMQLNDCKYKCNHLIAQLFFTRGKYFGVRDARSSCCLQMDHNRMDGATGGFFKHAQKQRCARAIDCILWLCFFIYF